MPGAGYTPLAPVLPRQGVGGILGAFASEGRELTPLHDGQHHHHQLESYASSSFPVNLRPKLRWVGEGQGKYEESDRYEYVGPGAGDYDLVMMPPTASASPSRQAPSSSASASNHECVSQCWSCSLLLIVLVACALALAYGTGQLDQFGFSFGGLDEEGEGMYTCESTLPPQIVQAAGAPGQQEADWQTKASELIMASWSPAKRSWCCRHEHIGCEMLGPPAEPAAMQRPGPPTVTAPADAVDQLRGGGGPPDGCSAAKNRTMSSHQRSMCCQRHGLLCPSSSRVASLCTAPRDLAARVNADTRQWCCRVHGLLCTHQKPFDCDAESMSDWSEGKQAWCCMHFSQACPHNCVESEGDTLETWTSARIKWCKSQRQREQREQQRTAAAPNVNEPQPRPPQPTAAATVKFDCSSSSPDSSWTSAQRAWCCEKLKTGCFKCEGDLLDWSPEEKNWCCGAGGADCTRALARNGRSQTTAAQQQLRPWPRPRPQPQPQPPEERSPLEKSSGSESSRSSDNDLPEGSLG